MTTMFEIAVGLECGGPEDGMMCRSCSDLYDVDVNLFQPEEDLFKEVAERYTEEYKDYPDFIGCRVVRLVPKKEADEIRKEQEWLDEHCVDGNIVW